MTKGLLVVVSGPSGAGKTSVCRFLYDKPDVVPSVSATTRAPRRGEVEGRDYFFLSAEEFERRIAKGWFLEWAKVFDNYYGTPKGPVLEAIGRGKICLLEIDVQGGKQVKENYPEALAIFIAPPSAEEAARRLESRRTESTEQRQRRIREFEREMAEGQNYDRIVVNRVLAEARRDVWQIIRNARR